MSDTQQPTIPAEDGEIEDILSSLLIATQLTTIGDNGLQAITSTYAITPEMLAEAKQKLLAREQRIALEARIETARSWLNAYQQSTGIGSDPFIKAMIIDISELQAQLSQLTQYNQSERSVEDE